MAQRGRPKKTTTDQEQPTAQSYWDRISKETQSNQSRLSMILGALIILVVGILVFNYFNREKPDLGPAQNVQQEEQDVSPDKLPGKYTVKEGDTLFIIAEKYYKDGDKFTEIAQANNLGDINSIVVGQVLEIPKLEVSSPSPTETPQATSLPSDSPIPTPESIGPMMQTSEDLTLTIWGPKISGTTYTVQEGDWLSKIAGRAYGDIFAYQKLAQINNIKNPDLIFPGQVLTIPR